MKILFLSVVTIVIISVFHQSCINYNHFERKETTRDTTISLMENIIPNEKKILIIFENSDIVVQTSLTKFIDEAPIWVVKNYNDRRLFNQIYKSLDIQDTCDVYILSQKMNIEIDPYLADIFEKGRCWIIKKKTGELVTHITIQYYRYICGGLCGEMGRRYFIHGIIFFSIIDAIA